MNKVMGAEEWEQGNYDRLTPVGPKVIIACQQHIIMRSCTSNAV
jgi:hypothetical protein